MVKRETYSNSLQTSMNAFLLCATAFLFWPMVFYLTLILICFLKSEDRPHSIQFLASKKIELILTVTYG